ncbi:MAG: hypothetical protein AUG49_06385 [Catenulispora sp. 13_1_20CM_3_70_7]|nr:MAG: hypothetical protein AUG49_06385 [Catenulispora sp. 13_1_20CM_3_70_7]
MTSTFSTDSASADRRALSSRRSTPLLASRCDGRLASSTEASKGEPHDGRGLLPDVLHGALEHGLDLIRGIGLGLDSVRAVRQ